MKWLQFRKLFYITRRLSTFQAAKQLRSAPTSTRDCPPIWPVQDLLHADRALGSRGTTPPALLCLLRLRELGSQEHQETQPPRPIHRKAVLVEWRLVPRSEPCRAPRTVPSLGSSCFHLTGARIKSGEGADCAQSGEECPRPRTAEPDASGTAKGCEAAAWGPPRPASREEARIGQSVKTKGVAGARSSRRHGWGDP